MATYMGHANIGTMYTHYLHLFGDDQTDDMARLATVSGTKLAPVGEVG